MRFIRPVEVLRMIGVSRTTLWRMVQAGAFPAPVRITDRSRGYVLEDVEAWMKARTERASPVPVTVTEISQARVRRPVAAAAAHGHHG
jgi:predicted DNA-binding transcriptional regulator AlpA